MPTRTQKSTKRTSRSTRRTSSRPATRRQSAPDVIAELKKDHREARDMFKKMSALGPRAQKSRQKIADGLVKELSKHAAAEEQVLYPNLRKIRGGDRMADHAIAEHQELKEQLNELVRTKPDDEQFDALIKQIKKSFVEHAREEEQEVFPRLRKNASKDELATMGKLIRGAKRVAPTRPHPKAPNTPPGNIVIGTAAAVVDRARDAARSVRR